MTRGVQTNGIGKTTTAHLNLTRSLADVWGLNKPVVHEPRKVPYAGYDRREKR